MKGFADQVRAMNDTLGTAFGDPAVLILASGDRVPVMPILTRGGGSLRSRNSRQVKRNAATLTAELPQSVVTGDWRAARLELNGVVYRLSDCDPLDDGNAIYELARDGSDTGTSADTDYLHLS